MKKTTAIIAGILALIVIATAAYAAYHRSVTLTGNIYLDLPTPSPTPTRSPTPTFSADDWIKVARDALARTKADDSALDALEKQGKDTQNGSTGTQSSYSGLSAVESLATNEEQRGWVREVRSQISTLHSQSVAANSQISQTAGALYPWLTDQYVGGWNTAEDNYKWYNEATNDSDRLRYYDRLKESAIQARDTANGHDQIVLTAQAQFDLVEKCGQDAWNLVEALRVRIVSANATPTPKPKALLAPPAATPSPAPAPTSAPTAGPTPGQTEPPSASYGAGENSIAATGEPMASSPNDPPE